MSVKFASMTHIFQASPCLRFNKEGILLAVSTHDNGIKILANADGIRLLRSIENRALGCALDASRAASATVAKVKYFVRYFSGAQYLNRT